MRIHLTIAVLLVGETLVIGSGLGAVAIILGLAFFIAYFISGGSNRRMFIQAVLYAAAGLASLAITQLNWRVGTTRSELVINACRQFRAKYQRYPERLDELVPEFIPSVPHAGFTAVSRRFLYAPQPPHVGFAVMFHGVTSYDFDADKWLTNE